jgi:hypothetical protein
MRIILITLIISTLSYGATYRPEKGLYSCIKGNEDSICDQIVKPFFSGEQLTAISVEYVGECGSMGPYTYYCENYVCEDAGLRFQFKSTKSYSWENKQYGFKCEFEKK